MRASPSVIRHKSPSWLTRSSWYNGKRDQHPQDFNYVQEVTTCARR